MQEHSNPVTPGSSGINRCAALACMTPPAIELAFPAGNEPEATVPYCPPHAVVVARAFGAIEAEESS